MLHSKDSVYYNATNHALTFLHKKKRDKFATLNVVNILTVFN